MSDRIAVVGAGIIGICTALKALEKGYEVWLIDPQEAGMGCSSGNAGHFATEQVFPLADPALLTKIPGMLINPLGPLAIRPSYFFKALPWLWRFILQMRQKKRAFNTKTLRALCEAALPAWQKLLCHYNLSGHITLKGSLLVFESTSLDEIIDVQRTYLSEGVKVMLLTRQELDRLEPGLADTVTHALYFEDVGHTSNPLLLSQALTQCFIAAGGNFLKQAVTEIEQESANWRLSFQHNTTFNTASSNSLTSTTPAAKPTPNKSKSSEPIPRTFDKVVICAGVYSKKLCQQLGYPVPLEAERGYHLNSLPAQMPQRPIASYERKFIMTPMTIGLRLAGTVEFAGITANPNPRRADGFYEHGRALWPSLARAKNPRREENRWMGHRPSLPDSLPIISTAREANLYFNFGHQHLGLTLAALSAEYITQLLHTGHCVGTKTLSIGRFNK